MSPKLFAGTLAALAVFAANPGPARAQQQSGQPQQGAGARRQASADSSDLVFRREVFNYPSYERRNPFKALVGTGEGGPRFEELRLLGILKSPNPDLSVALLVAGPANEGSGGSVLQRTYRVREGQTLGNTRILEIQESKVIVEVTDFGVTEQRELALQQPAEGGSS